MDKGNSFLKKLLNTCTSVFKPRENIVVENKSLATIEEDLKQKNELLRLQNERLSNIAWLASHKVRGPVASILGLSKLFNRDNYVDPDNAKIIEGIYASANELDLIIKELVAKAGEKDA